MRRKFLLSFVFVIIAFSLLPTAAHADIGPKPSVKIDFVGLENKIYYVTLLSKEESNGPYSVSSQPIEEYLLSEEYRQDDIDACKAFRNYRDADGFYFIEYFSRSNDKNTFDWDYYPPSTFKILVYFPFDGSFVSSEVQERYAFDSYYRASVSENETVFTVKRNYYYTAEFLSLIARILLTVTIEVLIALLFGLRKKNIFLFILAVNLITQIALNILLNTVNYTSGGFAFVFIYICMEIFIVLIEGIVYSLYFRKAGKDKPIKKWVAPVYSVVANLASFAAGIFISLKLPGIF